MYTQPPRKINTRPIGSRITATSTRLANMFGQVSFSFGDFSIAALAVAEFLQGHAQLFFIKIRPVGRAGNTIREYAPCQIRKLLPRSSPDVRMIRSGSGTPAVKR